MNKNKLISTIFSTIVLLSFCVVIIGCQSETEPSITEKIIYRDRTSDVIPGGQGGPSVTPGAKITSLQVAINKASPNDVIDLNDQKYSGITIEKSIDIDRAVTIKNFPDLGGAQLNIGA
ncbi:MAG: hypothetical protein J6Y01_08420, partial [Spirochaetales bacterium]|nr:hypothetical protein [Spirochaetales bacterium]